MSRHPSDPRWVRNAELARYLSITEMTLWRWQRDPKMAFPQPAVVRGMPYTDLDEIDGWMKAHVIAKHGGGTEKADEVRSPKRRKAEAA